MAQDLSKSLSIMGLSRAMRYGIIDTNGAVVNVIDYSEAPAQPPPGFGAGFIAVQSDDVGPGWTYSDGVFTAPPSPPPPPERDISDLWGIISFKIAFNHENRIRALEGKAVITAEQFKTAVKAAIGAN